ncbi:MAG: DNA-directed RNA polymerase subunit beta, partial [Candidatus Hodgkinia cicadicola]
ILEAQLGLISLQWGKEFAQILKFYSFSNDLNLFYKTVLPKLTEVFPNLEASNCTPEQALAITRELSQGVRFACPPFSKIKKKRWDALRHRNRITDRNFQTQLYDGLTGKPFDRKVTVGMIYMLKLNHMVEDKINARATGPYSSVTQQPIKGKTRKGGQRMGEMEMWALQSHGAAFSLKEALTIKCDDVDARSKFCPQLIASKIKLNTTWGESFMLLINELKSLCINITFNSNER